MSHHRECKQIREQDPLKQGLKPVTKARGRQQRFIREQDPLKKD